MQIWPAIDLRGGGKNLGIGNKAIFAKVRSEVSFLDKDRPLDQDIAGVIELQFVVALNRAGRGGSS
jgi:histidine ammonia-lyase